MARPNKMIYRFLDTVGDGSGSTNANGNYASAADEFLFQASERTELYRMIVHIEDTQGFQAEEYGNLAAALTNGITLTVEDQGGTEILDMTNNVPVKTNGDWGRYCYDVDLKSWGAGNEVLQARWTFERSGSPLILDLNEQLIVTLNDDLSGLVQHYFMVQGIEIS